MHDRTTASWRRRSDKLSSEAQLESWEGEGGKTAASVGRRRVLIVDSDTGAADSLELMLHAAGFSETRVAYSGPAALAIATEFRPNVVLLDLSLFDTNSYELAQALREQAQSRDLRMIALTPSHEHSAREQARAAGFERYLVKPVASLDLSALLDSMYR